jgi:hypothetical protein
LQYSTVATFDGNSGNRPCSQRFLLLGNKYSMQYSTVQ